MLVKHHIPLTDEQMEALETDSLIAYLKGIVSSKEDTVRTLEEENLRLLAKMSRINNEKEAEVSRINNEKEAEVSRIKAEKEAEISRIQAEKEAEISRIRAEHRTEIEAFFERMRMERARFWGFSSDRVLPAQIPLFNDAEAFSDPKAKEPTFEEVCTPPKSRGKRKKGVRAQNLAHLPVEVIEHDLDDDERTCTACGEKLAEMTVEVTRKLKVIPARFICEERRRHVYVCRCCSKKNAADGTTPSVIVRAPVPISPIEKSIATPSLLAALINEKYACSKPIARIEADFVRSADITLPRSVMCNWMIVSAKRWFSPIYARMKDDLLSRDVLHSDDTKVQVLKEPGRKPTARSFMWVWTTADEDTPISLFEYSPSRSRDVPAAFLGGWKGYVHADGYEVYHGLSEGIVVSGCLAHVRRYFTDIVKALGADGSKGSVAAEAVRKLDNIFHVEHSLAGMDADARKNRRLSEIKPLLDSFYAWLGQIRSNAVPGYSLSRAINYAFNQRPYVENVLLDGRLALTNNRAERAIRPFAIGRRNFLFSDTPEGAEASAVLFSVVQTALENKLRPFDYLTWVLTELPNCDLTADPDAIARFVPYSDAIPRSCRQKASDGSLETDEDAQVPLPEGMDIEEFDRLARQLEEYEEENAEQ